MIGKIPNQIVTTKSYWLWWKFIDYPYGTAEGMNVSEDTYVYYWAVSGYEHGQRDKNIEVTPSLT